MACQNLKILNWILELRDVRKKEKTCTPGVDYRLAVECRLVHLFPGTYLFLGLGGDGNVRLLFCMRTALTC